MVEDNKKQEPAAREGADGPGKEQHAKPLLTVEQQIAHMKSKGITFELCSEEDAAEYLSFANNFLRTSAYRKLFQVQTEGEHVGDYVNLDFEHLRKLASFDRGLREVFLAACVDIEHFAKIRLLRLCEERGEDGYAIVDDFLGSLNHAERSRLVGSLRSRGSSGPAHDEYSGDLIARCQDSFPVWVLFEVVELGALVNFVLYCAARWNDEELRGDHYVLRSVKALRNACAHNSLVVNGFCASGERAGYSPERAMLSSLTEHGVPNTKSRRLKLKNLRIAQIAALLYSLDRFCERAPTHARHAARFASLRCDFERIRPLLASNSPLLSYFDFMWKLIDAWLPVGQNSCK